MFSILIFWYAAYASYPQFFELLMSRDCSFAPAAKCCLRGVIGFTGSERLFECLHCLVESYCVHSRQNKF